MSSRSGSGLEPATGRLGSQIVAFLFGALLAAAAKPAQNQPRAGWAAKCGVLIRRLISSRNGTGLEPGTGRLCSQIVAVLFGALLAAAAKPAQNRPGPAGMPSVALLFGALLAVAAEPARNRPRAGRAAKWSRSY